MFSGEGVPDLLLVLIFWAQRSMAEKLAFQDELEVLLFHKCYLINIFPFSSHFLVLCIALTFSLSGFFMSSALCSKSK